MKPNSTPDFLKPFYPFIGAPINFEVPPKILKTWSADVCYHLFDFFHIFGNQYSPANTILCPYYGRLFLRHGLVLMDPENQKYVRTRIRPKWSKVTTNMHFLFVSVIYRLIDMVDNAASQQWNPPHAFMYVSDIILQKQCPNVMANISESAVREFQAQARKMVNVMIGAGIKHMQHILWVLTLVSRLWASI